MKKIEVDQEVYEKLKKLADPFVETTPNHVLRRILGLPLEKKAITKKKARKRKISRDTEPWGVAISKLRKETDFVHPAFLTYLVDKFYDGRGNFKISDIIPFMEEMNLVSASGAYLNPWMPGPYKGKASCQNTIAHYRECRRFGCWGGRDYKDHCDNLACFYHPQNSSGVIKNKCDLRKGVIWKRRSAKSEYSYGAVYLEVVAKELLGHKRIPLHSLLTVFYPQRHTTVDMVERGYFEYGHDNLPEGDPIILENEITDKFAYDFNFTDREIDCLFTYPHKR
jgi:hypothetical protein